MVAPYSIVVPVFNEAGTLRSTVPSLLSAVGSDRAEIVYVCNGCEDESAELIRDVAGDRVRVIELEERGKTAAFNSGDQMVSAFPRFYVDADVILPPGAFAKLADVLASGAADLVSPRIRYDLSACSPVARAIACCWLALPHARQGPCQLVIGLSAAGRRTWTRFPAVIADDLFMTTKVGGHRQIVVQGVTVRTSAPSSLRGWIEARARWRQGERQLERQGLSVPRAPGQKSELLGMLLQHATMAGAAAFLGVRLAAELRAWLDDRNDVGWRSDRR